MSRDFQLPGRSPVIACDGMAATSHPLATLAAIDALRAGGTAADAAVAAVAVLCVVEPHMTGIGGDCFSLVSRPGKPVWGYNGSGRAGMNASDQVLRAKGLARSAPPSMRSPCPGQSKRGRKSSKRMAALVSTARWHPRSNMPRVDFRSPRVWLGTGRDTLPSSRAMPERSRHYLFNGGAPKEGDVIRFPALASTLKAIATKGARAFYEGEIADDMARTLAARDSFLTSEDFARHRGDVVTPISTNYRGLDLVEIPPNAQGLTALVMLNILENFDVGKLDPLGADRFHLVLEAARLGYAIRDTHIADDAHMRTSVKDLLDKNFAKKLSSLIDMKKRAKLPRRATPGNDTVYLTVVDRDRTAVSFINSLYSSFGLGICTEKTGIMLTNRGACFTLEQGHPNVFGPGKRPMHTIIPALAMRNGRCDMSFGVMGAHYQPMGHVQIILNMLDYGMDVQQAIDAPRFFFEGEQTDVEHGTPIATIDGLKARGHDVAMASLPWGGAQTIKIDWDRGVLIAGSEPRKDGCALGY
jgi:gamma-glutamyltranspeptidase/glutathione hydrolase